MDRFAFFHQLCDKRLGAGRTGARQQNYRSRSGRQQRQLDKEIVRLHWLTRDELQKRKAEHRSPLVQRCVDDFLAGRRFPLELFSPEFA